MAKRDILNHTLSHIPNLTESKPHKAIMTGILVGFLRLIFTEILTILSLGGERGTPEFVSFPKIYPETIWYDMSLFIKFYVAMPTIFFTVFLIEV